MPTYQAVIEGRNFLVEMNGKQQRQGFYQTVIVEAIDPDQAERRAIELVKTSSDLKDLVRNDRSDPPVLHLDALSEIEPPDMTKPSPRGRTWYPEES